MQPAQALPDRDPATGRFQKPAYLVATAQEMGFADEEIADLTGEQLTRQILRVQRNALALQQDFNRQRTLDNASVKQPVPPQPPPPPDEFDLGLDESQYDPALVQAIRRVADASKKKIGALEGELGEYQKKEQARDLRTTETILDEAFASLPKEIQKNFGEGPVANLKQGGKEIQRRIALVRSAGIDLTKVPSMTAGQVKKLLTDQAALMYETAAVVPDAGAYAGSDAPVAKNGRISKEQWNAGGTAKPTQRRGSPEPKGEALAIANLERKLKEEGGSIPDSEELDGFPD